MDTPEILEILEKMRDGVDSRFPVSLRSFQMMVRPLSMYEKSRIMEEVIAEMRLLPEEQRTAFKEATLMASKTLKLASTSDVGQQDYTIDDMVLNRMTGEEVQHLYRQYCAVEVKLNPSLELMEQSELDAMVEALKKTPREELALRLTQHSFLELVNLSRCLLTAGD